MVSRTVTPDTVTLAAIISARTTARMANIVASSAALICCFPSCRVLTGDKVETAINIGRSCRLLTDAMRGDQLIVIDVDEALGDAEAMAETMEALAAAEAALSRPGLNTEQTAIVVSGKALGFVFPRRKLNKHNKEIIPPQKILDQEAALQMRVRDTETR